MTDKQLSGKWIGYYKYGKRYPVEMQALPVPFEIILESSEQKVKGICVDEEGKKFFKEPSTIEGNFQNGIITFIKKYPCYFGTDDNNQSYISKDMSSLEIHYSGIVKKSFFFGISFKGKWSLENSFVDETGQVLQSKDEGTWKMRKINSKKTFT